MKMKMKSFDGLLNALDDDSVETYKEYLERIDEAQKYCGKKATCQKLKEIKARDGVPIPDEIKFC